MTRIILSGCNGKMGNVISRLCVESKDAKIVCGVDLNTKQNWDYPVVSGFDECRAEADVIIDFSNPVCLDDVLSYATKNKIGAVIATTGYTDEQKKKISAASKETAVFFSANMSLGINLLIELAKRAAKLLEGSFDIEIIEKHHNQKIDAPSGTALAIADAVSDVLRDTPNYVYDRHSQRIKRGKSEIGIHSVRGGTIVGEHEIIFAGNDEVIELKHQASSKEVFAVGAVKAASYIAGKKPGMYSMSDLVRDMQA